MARKVTVTYPEPYIQKIYNTQTKTTSYRFIGSIPNKNFSGPNAFEEALNYKAEIMGTPTESLTKTPRGAPQKTTFKSLGKDFPKFFEEYLNKKSAVKIGGIAKGTTNWFLMEDALKKLPHNASLEQKWNAIRDFRKPSDIGKKTGTSLSATIKDSFKKYKVNINTIDIEDLSKLMPKGYKYKTLQAMFADAAKDPSSFKGDSKGAIYKRNKIINSRNFIQSLKDKGLKQVPHTSSGSPYLFEKPDAKLTNILKDVAVVTASQSKTLRDAITKFSKASDDYRNSGFSKSQSTLKEAATNLNKVLMDTFTDRNIPRSPGGEYSARELRNANTLDKAISKTNASKLRNFINNNPDLRTKLELAFEPQGVKTGNYFKTRNLSKLSAGQLLRDLTVEKDHIFPMSDVQKLEKGKFGKGAVLAESPYNKALSASYVNNSLRNNIQHFLNANPNNIEALKQIDAKMKSINVPLYAGGRHLGGNITPIVKRQIETLGLSDLKLDPAVTEKLGRQTEIIKGYKTVKFKDPHLESLQKIFRQSSGAARYEIAFTLGCVGKAAGGRIGLALGGDAVNCVNTKLNTQTLESSQKIVAGIEEGATGVLGKMRNAARGFLGFAKKGGKFGAIAAAGAASAALVKTFMNDDPSTYLSNEDQQKNMLIDMITSPLDDTPQESPAVLDWQLPVLGAETVAGTAVTAPSTIEAARSARFGKKPSGITKTALKSLGRGLMTTGTPLGLAALEPLHIAGQIQQGDSLTDVATNPWNYLGPAFMPSMTKAATKGLGAASNVAKVMRLGLPMAAVNAWNPIGWGLLAGSVGIEGYKQYQDYKNKRGWFSDD